jgi:hypothetical protein
LLELSRVHKAAVKAFPERVHESVVNGEVRVSISGDTVHIRLDANEIFSHRTRATWAARINELKLPLPEGVKHLRADAGALDARPHYPQFDHVDDDGDVDTNPNWPSKTGNPSGGGRGNNPPR